MNDPRSTYVSIWLKLENIILSEKNNLQTVHIIYNSRKHLKHREQLNV